MKDQIERKHGIQTSMSGYEEKIGLNKNCGILLFRSIKELLINVIKHAKAEQINVDFYVNANLLEIIVADNGIGFDYKSEFLSIKNQSYGLFSIQERISGLGGELKIDSKSGKGTKIKMSIPISENK